MDTQHETTPATECGNRERGRGCGAMGRGVKQGNSPRNSPTASRRPAQALYAPGAFRKQRTNTDNQSKIDKGLIESSENVESNNTPPKYIAKSELLKNSKLSKSEQIVKADSEEQLDCKSETGKALNENLEISNFQEDVQSNVREQQDCCECEFETSRNEKTNVLENDSINLENNFNKLCVSSQSTCSVENGMENTRETKNRQNLDNGGISKGITDHDATEVTVDESQSTCNYVTSHDDKVYCSWQTSEECIKADERTADCKDCEINFDESKLILSEEVVDPENTNERKYGITNSKQVTETPFYGAVDYNTGNVEYKAGEETFSNRDDKKPHSETCVEDSDSTVPCETAEVVNIIMEDDLSGSIDPNERDNKTMLEGDTKTILANEQKAKSIVDTDGGKEKFEVLRGSERQCKEEKLSESNLNDKDARTELKNNENIAENENVENVEARGKSKRQCKKEEKAKKKEQKMTKKQVKIKSKKIAKKCDSEVKKDGGEVVDFGGKEQGKKEQGKKEIVKKSNEKVTNATAKVATVLEVQRETTQSIPSGDKIGSQRKRDSDEGEKQEEDWEKAWDDDEECLNENILAELGKEMGTTNLEIVKPQFDYLTFKPNDIILDKGVFDHVVEIYDFSSEFKTHDLMNSLSNFKQQSFEIHWVDDTHALAVFSNHRTAQQALGQCSSPMLKLRSLYEGTQQSKLKAKRNIDILQPHKERPQTTKLIANRLVAGALGMRSKMTREERLAEREKIKVEREKKKTKEKQKIDLWESDDL